MENAEVPQPDELGDVPAKRGPKPGSSWKWSKTVEKKIWQDELSKYARERVAAEWEELLTSAIDAAKGSYFVANRQDGKTRVYRSKPDAKPLMDLLDRVMGKPVQAVDVTSDGEKVEVAQITFAVIQNNNHLHVERQTDTGLIDAETGGGDGEAPGQGNE